MKILTAEYRDRIQQWLNVLQKDFYTPLEPIQFEAARTKDLLSIQEAKNLQYIPVEPGFSWGNEWDYCWFRGTIVLPEEARGQRIIMDIKPGGESTLFINGNAFGTYRAPWVRTQSHYLVDNCLTRCGVPGDSYEILMETYAGHDFPASPEFGCGIGPVMPGLYEKKPDTDSRRTLGLSTIGIWNEDAYQLFLDADTLWRLLGTLDESSLRAAKIAEVLEKFTRTAEFEQEREKRIASYRKAREVLKPALEAVNGSTSPVFYAVGNAHLDLAWLWPMAETYRKTARTFAAQLRLLDEYPEYCYLQSQPAAYEMCRHYYPELFERIREAIKGGRWIAEGAMWVEPDTNLAGGEALVRQLIYGLAYYEDVLGVESKVLWLPDSFGYTGALPQILRKSGVNYLVTQKIFWSYNEGEKFPYHYFTWVGIDGSKVTAFLPTSYTYQTDPEEINRVWRERTQVRDLNAFIFPFGYGDGGGGPARDHIEYLQREKNLEGMPRVKQCGPAEFFTDLEKREGKPVNTYHGELYFDAHRGTYTTQAQVKKNNRKAEIALREMEIWGVTASIFCSDPKYDVKEAADYWKELLLHQFHDILPGSGIGRIYQETEQRMGSLIQKVERETDILSLAVAEKLTKVNSHGGRQCVSIFNSLSFPRSAFVELPESFAAGAMKSDGSRIPVEVFNGTVRAIVTIPALGSVSLLPDGSDNKIQPDQNPIASIKETGDMFWMENSKIRACINKRGEVTSFVLRESGREYAAGPMNVFHLYKDIPRTYDAWDIDSNYIDQEIDAISDVSVSIEEEKGLRVVLAVTGKISHSSFEQKIILTAESSRIEFATRIDWKELHRLLKVGFPIDVFSETGINEIQYGYVERPTKRSRQYEKDRFEVCNHRYSVLCDGSHGGAILNDGKYGISMNDNSLELTLLRAAASPDMRTDNRVHEFTYAFTAFEGPFAGSDIIRQGLELNVPVKVLLSTAADFSLINIDKSNVILDAMKLAEDGSGDIILRFYEAEKAAVSARIRTGLNGKAWICDLRERKQEEISMENGVMDVTFSAFEIVTIRIACEEMES